MAWVRFLDSCADILFVERITFSSDIINGHCLTRCKTATDGEEDGGDRTFVEELRLWGGYD